jgi:AcrR family transcriptional regulator
MPSDRSERPDIASQIVEQATRLFAAHGFVGASLRDIAKAVGIRKPSLLYHFPSKDELRRRVLEQMLEHWNEAVPRILRAATSGSEQFDAIATETVQFFSVDPDRARLLLRELLDRPEEMAPLIELHVQPWATIVCDYIRKGQEQGRVHPEVDPEAYIVGVISLVLGTVALHASFGDLLPHHVAGVTNPDDESSDEGRERTSTMSARLIDETLRAAKAALFITPPPQTDPQPKAATQN